MKFCCVSENMTPEVPIFMHGFGARQHKSAGVHDPLYVKAAMLTANKTLLILTIDALGSDRSFVTGVKDALKETFGLEYDEVLINFSHTHHSVFLTGLDSASRRGGYSIAQDGWKDNDEELDYSADESLFRRIRDMILRMTEYCRGNLIEGELSIGRGRSDFAVSRRRPDGDGVAWRPYYEGEIDKDLFVLKLTDRTGAVKGILYNYGCHTTSMGPDNMLLSNDFAGKTSRVLETAYPGACALFLQGCAGELKPLKSADGDKFRSLSITEMEEAGADLASDVVSVLESATFRTIDGPFRTKLVDPLLYTEQTDASFYDDMANDPGTNAFYRSAAKRTIRAIHDGTVKDRLPHYISLWHLDDQTRLVAMEGEVSTEYSLLIKKWFGPLTTMTLGYTNGVYCYVPTRKMIGEGGYEANCNFFFNLRGPFVPEIEDIILGQIVQAEMALREKPAK
jgi:hypothetical protein